MFILLFTLFLFGNQLSVDGDYESNKFTFHAKNDFALVFHSNLSNFPFKWLFETFDNFIK